MIETRQSGGGHVSCVILILIPKSTITFLVTVQCLVFKLVTLQEQHMADVFCAVREARGPRERQLI